MEGTVVKGRVGMRVEVLTEQTGEGRSGTILDANEYGCWVQLDKPVLIEDEARNVVSAFWSEVTAELWGPPSSASRSPYAAELRAGLRVEAMVRGLGMFGTVLSVTKHGAFVQIDEQDRRGAEMEGSTNDGIVGVVRENLQALFDPELRHGSRPSLSLPTADHAEPPTERRGAKKAKAKLPA